jgi:hypothetical protein
MMMLLSRMKMEEAVAELIMEEEVDDIISSSKWRQQRLLCHIIKGSSFLLNLDVEGRAMRNNASYSISICQHEDLGDILLRSIISYL